MWSSLAAIRNVSFNVTPTVDSGSSICGFVSVLAFGARWPLAKGGLWYTMQTSLETITTITVIAIGVHTIRYDN